MYMGLGWDVAWAEAYEMKIAKRELEEFERRFKEERAEKERQWELEWAERERQRKLELKQYMDWFDTL